MTKHRSPKLRDLRVEAVASIARDIRARTIVDVGCGEGRFAKRLLMLRPRPFVFGVDLEPSMIEPEDFHIRMLRSSAVCKADVFLALRHLRDFDLALGVEVIEHFSQKQLTRFERLFFDQALAKTWIVTTPNSECNIHLPRNGEPARRLRHVGHKFEFSQNQFGVWVSHICKSFNLFAVCGGIGPNFGDAGQPTHLAVFFDDPKRAEKLPAKRRGLESFSP